MSFFFSYFFNYGNCNGMTLYILEGVLKFKIILFLYEKYYIRKKLNILSMNLITSPFHVIFIIASKSFKAVIA